MDVYFIRHGETRGNLEHRHQADASPLTPLGVAQAREIAGRVKALQPTHLVTSPLLRAIETAREIGAECDLIPEINWDLVEIKRPEKMCGYRYTSFRSLWFYGLWFFGLSFSGESYKSLRQRIESAKAHFNQYPDDARVVVISHSVFINMFLVHMCRKRVLNIIDAAKTLKSILAMRNTTLVPLRYEKGETSVCAWSQADQRLESS